MNASFFRKETFDESYRVAAKLSDDLVLVPVGNWITKTTYILNMLEWRNTYKEYFFFDNEVDLPNFCRYVLNPFLSGDSRLLFLIFYNQALSGHIGLREINYGNFELTQVVKGFPQLGFQMSVVVNEFLEDCREKFGLNSALLHVKKSNERAIRLYERCAFERVGHCDSGHQDCAFMRRILN
jgi:RimJ/RimL family protein N-acetyltransferase